MTDSNKTIEQLLNELIATIASTLKPASKFDKGMKETASRIRKKMQIVRERALFIRFEIQKQKRAMLPRTKHKRGLERLPNKFIQERERRRIERSSQNV